MHIGEVSTIPQWEKCERPEAIKLMEESAEVFRRIEEYIDIKNEDVYSENDALYQSSLKIKMHRLRDARQEVIDEACDVIVVICNILAGLDVEDLEKHMQACEKKNRERGYYGD